MEKSLSHTHTHTCCSFCQCGPVFLSIVFRFIWHNYRFHQTQLQRTEKDNNSNYKNEKQKRKKNWNRKKTATVTIRICMFCLLQNVTIENTCIYHKHFRCGIDAYNQKNIEWQTEHSKGEWIREKQKKLWPLLSQFRNQIHFQIQQTKQSQQVHIYIYIEEPIKPGRKTTSHSHGTRSYPYRHICA